MLKAAVKINKLNMAKSRVGDLRKPEAFGLAGLIKDLFSLVDIRDIFYILLFSGKLRSKGRLFEIEETIPEPALMLYKLKKELSSKPA